MALHVLIIAFLYIAYDWSTVVGDPSQSADAMDWVWRNSNPHVRPGDGPLTVEVGLHPIKIRDVDVARGEVEMVVWMMYKWRDERLDWSSDLDTENVRVDVDNHLWIPDVVAYNLVEAPEVLTPKIALVSADGQVMYMPGHRIRFHCSLEGLDTPQGANCTLKFGSWTYSGSEIDLQMHGPPVMTDYVDNSKVGVTFVTGERNEKTYSCCPGTYPDVTFYLGLRNRDVGRGLFNW